MPGDFQAGEYVSFLAVAPGEISPYTDYPLQSYTPLPRHILFPNQVSWRTFQMRPELFPPEFISRTEYMLRESWLSFSPEHLKRRNYLCSLSGGKLHRILDAMFQKKRTSSRTNGIEVGTEGWFQFLWHDTITGCSGKDIVSLWAERFNIRYLDAIDALYEYLDAHHELGDKDKNGKPYWVEEAHPLTLNMPVPYLFDSLFAVASQTFVAGYFWKNALIGCACKFEHPYYSELESFYTLMRRYDSNRLQWIPRLPPEGSTLFFQKDLISDMNQNIVFIEDEFLAHTTLKKWKRESIDSHITTVPLSFPGKLQTLATMDLSFVSGRHVTIELPDENQFADRRLMESLIQKFSQLKVNNLLFKHSPTMKTRTREELIAELTLQIGAEDTLSNSRPFITSAGQDIPGSDIERHELLAPLLRSGFIAWIYGPEKSGKGWLAILMAYVIATGGRLFGRFDAPEPRRVLLLDGESLPDLLTEKIQKVLRGANYPGKRPFDIKVAKEKGNDTMINLSDPEQHRTYAPLFGNYDVVIIDNVYSMTDNKQNIRPFLDWLRMWTSEGITFLVFDHTNKEGELQGSADKKRIADLCIEICKEGENLVTLSFPVFRHGIAPKPIDLRIVSGDDFFRFEIVEKLSDDRRLKLTAPQLRKLWAHEAKRRDLSPEDSGKIINYGPSTIYQWLKDIANALKQDPTCQSEEIVAYQRELDRLQGLSSDDFVAEGKRLAK